MLALVALSRCIVSTPISHGLAQRLSWTTVQMPWPRLGAVRWEIGASVRMFRDHPRLGQGRRRHLHPRRNHRHAMPAGEAVRMVVLQILARVIWTMRSTLRVRIAQAHSLKSSATVLHVPNVQAVTVRGMAPILQLQSWSERQISLLGYNSLRLTGNHSELSVTVSPRSKAVEASKVPRPHLDESFSNNALNGDTLVTVIFVFVSSLDAT